MKGVSAVPQRVLFVEELSELLIEGLPDLWKLGQAYFNGDLAADVCAQKRTPIESRVDLCQRSFLIAGSEKSTSENETCIFLLYL